jgi:DNA repair exonuclease SbcCD ATPase subunit
MSKDKTRSIRLDADVAELAQRLADDGKLSATISQLLRQHFAIHGEIDIMKTKLDELVNQRMSIREQEEELSDLIDQMENRHAMKLAEQKPWIERKLKQWNESLERSERKLLAARNQNEIIAAQRAIANAKIQISILESELE